MTIDYLRTTTKTAPADATLEALREMLRRANGGSTTDRVVLRRAGDPPAAPDVDTLTVTLLPSGGGLTVEIGVATHWTRLRHRGCRFALTPGDQIILIGRDAGGTLHAWLDEGRLFFDRGSPLRTAAAEAEAVAAFDAAVATIMAEAA